VVASEHVGPDLAELLGHEIAEHRDTHRAPAYEPPKIWENPAMNEVDLLPSGFESVLMDIAVIGGLIATIVIGLLVLRNHRRR
jgi:hypothetical protein